MKWTHAASLIAAGIWILAGCKKESQPAGSRGQASAANGWTRQAPLHDYSAQMRERGTLRSLMRNPGLTPEKLAELEKEVAANPRDLEKWVQLFAFYSRNRQTSPESAKKFEEAYVWFVERHPGSLLATTDLMRLRARDPFFKKSVELWTAQANEHPRNAMVLGNAAELLGGVDRKKSEELLHKAAELEPKNPYWPERLAVLYSFFSEEARTPQAKKEFAEKALDYYDKAFALDSSGMLRQIQGRNAARIALQAERWNKAALLAQELIGDGFETLRPVDPTTHHFAHTLIGVAAVRQSQIEEAKARLMKSVQFEAGGRGGRGGGASLQRPSLALAKELLEKKETDAVLAFFTALEKVWNGREVATWRAQVERGRIPDFGAFTNI